MVTVVCSFSPINLGPSVRLSELSGSHMYEEQRSSVVISLRYIILERGEKGFYMMKDKDKKNTYWHVS